MLVEFLLGIILFIGTFLWWWQISAKSYWKKTGVSYIEGPPLIGALIDVILFKKSFAELLSDIYNSEKFRDDPVSGVYFYHKASLVIRHPELIKNILVKDFSNFVDRNINTDPVDDVIGSNNIFLTKGDYWRTIRHKFSPILTGKLKNFFLSTVDVTKTLEEKLLKEISDQPQEYEMKQLASFFITDVISISVFGVQANSLQNPNAEFYRSARTSFDFNWKRSIEMSTCFFFPELTKFFRCKVFSKETNDFLRSSINYVIEERVKSGAKCNDVIDVLIALNRENPEIFKGDALVGQAASILLANFETSSSAISFAFYELARHPDKQEKLRKEINDYVEKYGSLQYETINEMDYLNSVIKETLRLYPPVPFLDRVCAPTDGADSYSLEPYHKFAIPRGMPIYIPSVGVQRDPNFFPKPLEFIPERFTSENKDSTNQYTFLAFGHGPRYCIGSKFGYLQVKMALFTILKQYKVETTERTPKAIEFDTKAMSLQSKDPLYMNLKRIQ